MTVVALALWRALAGLWRGASARGVPRDQEGSGHLRSVVVRMPRPCRALLLLALAGATAAPLPSALYFTRHDLPLSAGVCTDGSSSTFYARNCSANWDSHSGIDYCPKGGPADPIRYIVVFAGEDVRPLLDVTSSPGPLAWDGSGSHCYSAASCASRSPNLTSSAGLPAAALPGGILSPYAEVNPNNYKAPMALVPYCSSDLWAGSTPLQPGPGPHFQGQRIALSVLAALAALPLRASLRSADEVVLVGPPGVAALPALAAAAGLLKPGAAVTFVCDGCALLPAPLPLPLPPPPCTTDANCPPHASLPLAAALWAMPRPPAQACAAQLPAWQCLTAPALLGAPWGGPGSPRLLLSAQGGDARAAAAYGRDAGVAAALGAALRGAVAAAYAAGGGVLARQGSAVFLSRACAAPSALALHADAYYAQRSGACRDGAGDLRNDTLAQVLDAAAECREQGVPADFCVTCWEGSGEETCVA